DPRLPAGVRSDAHCEHDLGPGEVAVPLTGVAVRADDHLTQGWSSCFIAPTGRRRIRSETVYAAGTSSSTRPRPVRRAAPAIGTAPRRLAGLNGTSLREVELPVTRPGKLFRSGIHTACNPEPRRSIPDAP